MDLHEQPGNDRALHLLETLALRHQILPLTQVSTPPPWAALQLTRRLAEGPRSLHPWVPIGNLGPLLILGHYNPASADFMGIPKPFRVETIIHKRDYEALHPHLFTSWDWEKSPARDPSWHTLSPPPPPLTLEAALQWFLRSYPFTENERVTVLTKLRPLIEMRVSGRPALDRLLPHLGIVLESLRAQRLVFQPRYAPPLARGDESSFKTLESFSAYPLLDSPRVRYWLLDDETDLPALEEAWNGPRKAPPQIVQVLALKTSIMRKLRRERQRHRYPQA